MPKSAWKRDLRNSKKKSQNTTGGTNGSWMRKRDRSDGADAKTKIQSFVDSWASQEASILADSSGEYFVDDETSHLLVDIQPSNDGRLTLVVHQAGSSEALVYEIPLMIDWQKLRIGKKGD